MRRILLAAAALVLVAGAVATAQDPKPAQPVPKVVQPRVLPVQPRPVTVTAARMAQLEEDYETLQAHREVRLAHVNAAEVATQAALKTYELINKAGVTPQSEVLKAKYDFEMAKAQLKIREAELKEVEVKLKFAKKRLDDAKAAGVRPAPGVRPVPVDPLPPIRAAADEKEVAQLKAALAKLQAEAEKKAAEAKRAETEVGTAKAELAAIFKLGGAPAGVRVKAAEKLSNALAARDTIVREQTTLKEQLAGLKAKLKEIEK